MFVPDKESELSPIHCTEKLLSGLNVKIKRLTDKIVCYGCDTIPLGKNKRLLAMSFSHVKKYIHLKLSLDLL